MRLLLVDGHYYVYRSFFAIRNLSNSRGEPTNAIYGFTKVLRKMLKDLQPDLAAVVWDEGLPERRTQLQPAYKETRAEMPASMVPQLETIRELVPLLGLASVAAPNTEADDLMASYACAARTQGYEVVLATNDKDLFQLVNDKVTVYTTNKSDLASPKDPFALLGEEHVRARWGVEPRQIGEVLALTGDSVDNITGVAGLGPKNAGALIREHGSVTALLNRLDAIKSDRIREKLEAAREQLLQNLEMVRLDTDLPLPVPLDDLRIQPRYPALIALLAQCEFKSLLDEVKAEVGRATCPPQGELF